MGSAEQDMKLIDPVPISEQSFYTKYPPDMIQNYIRDYISCNYYIETKFGPNYWVAQYTITSTKSAKGKETGNATKEKDDDKSKENDDDKT